MRPRDRSNRSSSVGRLIGAVLLVAPLVGCAGSDDSVKSAPTTPSSEIASEASPSPTSSGVAEWENEYSEEELAVYREAVQRVEAYLVKALPIWAAGEATRAARELFQDNLLTWRRSWAYLEMYDRRGIKIARNSKVLWTKPQSIQLLEKGGAEVRLVRCTDQSDLGATMNGEPLSEASTEPVIQKVDVYRYPDGRWRIGIFSTVDKKCEA
jgi:hypothetical protein